MDEHQQQPDHDRGHLTPMTASVDGIGAVLRRILANGPEPLEGPVEPVDPSCPICNDLGFVYADPDGITTKLCRCREAAWEAGKPERLLRHWEKATGIPKHYRAMRLETHPNLTGKDNPGLLARLTGADFSTASWFFYGKNSRGKTTMAVGYGWAFLQATGESVLFRAVPDLLAELRATYDRRSRDDEGGESEADLLYRYKTAGLLILDDLGAERIAETNDPANTWVADRLYTILNYRLGAELPTVFSSNITMRVLRERVGPRITERVIEMCAGGGNIVRIEGRNLRWDEEE